MTDPLAGNLEGQDGPSWCHHSGGLKGEEGVGGGGEGGGGHRCAVEEARDGDVGVLQRARYSLELGAGLVQEVLTPRRVLQSWSCLHWGVGVGEVVLVPRTSMVFFRDFVSSVACYFPVLTLC